MTAEVIRFPSRRRSASTDTPDNDRLRRALTGLQSALAEQRQAIAAWRTSLGELQTTVGGLGDGLRHYRGSLDKLQTDVSTLNSEARRLESWADTVLEQQVAARPAD